MRVLVLVLLAIVSTSCGHDKQDEPASTSLNLDEASKPVISEVEASQAIKSLRADKLEPFGSSADFNAYIEMLAKAQKQEHDSDSSSCENCSKDMGTVADAPPVAAAPSPDGAAVEDDSGITNNQEAGVDEGGIVKVVGDYLVVLRRGRLFTIRAENGTGDTLELVDTINAFPPKHSTNTWYDELLIHDRKIIVVGYSYGYHATEIGRFLLEEDGTISHQATNFLRSNDYYSSRNFASRLVDDKLIFYMPFEFYHRFNDAGRITLPGQAQLLDSGKVGDWRDIIDTETIIRPIEETTDPVLHTIATCDLSTNDFVCQATSLIGPSSRTFYVSPKAVYLWMSSTGASSAYRLPFDGSSPSAVLAEGVPTDQFSFKETDDGLLHVLLRESGYGDTMWAPEFRDGGIALLSLPLSQFSSQPVKVALSDYVILPKVDGYQMQNRFVGNHVLYGTEASWGRSENDRESVHIYDLKTKANTSIPISHDVQRIEAIGDNAMVIGSHEDDLVFSSIELHDEPRVVDSFTLENSSQGEHRSHGFFYKQLSRTTGMLGLPTRSESSFLDELTEASASVIYLSVENNKLSRLGSLDSALRPNVDDHCQASCVDWYGNSRPIFWRNRIFALLGYDLVEGHIQDNKITEVRRLDYTPHKLPDARPHDE